MNTIKFIEESVFWFRLVVMLIVCFLILGPPRWICWLHDVYLWGKGKPVMCPGCRRVLTKHV
jgi:hypothetical protein